MHRGSNMAIQTLLTIALLLSATPAVAEGDDAGPVTETIALDLASFSAPFHGATSGQYSPRAVGGPVVDPLYPTLIGAGGALLATGLLIAALSVRDANDLCDQAKSGAIPCPCPDGEPTEEQLPYKQVYDNAQIGIGVGLGIAALGGMAMAITIPVAIHRGKARQITLVATVDRPLEPFGPPSGVRLTVSVR